MRLALGEREAKATTATTKKLLRARRQTQERVRCQSQRFAVGHSLVPRPSSFKVLPFPPLARTWSPSSSFPCASCIRRPSTRRRVHPRHIPRTTHPRSSAAPHSPCRTTSTTSSSPSLAATMRSTSRKAKRESPFHLRCLVASRRASCLFSTSRSGALNSTAPRRCAPVSAPTSRHVVNAAQLICSRLVAQLARVW